VAQRPETLTWAVGEIDQKQRALCLQASHPSRIKVLMRHAQSFYMVDQPFGLTHVGVKMSAEAQRVILMGIRRQSKAATLSSAINRLSERQATLEVIRRVAAHHGLTLDDMTGRNRSRAAIRARGHAAHDLRNTLDLRMSEIASLLGMKRHSLVAYWLAKPYDEVSRQDRNPS
jgi:hypothetical protein